MGARQGGILGFSYISKQKCAIPDDILRKFECMIHIYKRSCGHVSRETSRYSYTRALASTPGRFRLQMWHLFKGGCLVCMCVGLWKGFVYESSMIYLT